ncbi:hypothetical protein GE061_014783 [Apolygus lucorum]|uniref:Ig-like domain-containing protein n=1 Tax=Apolygus lucorum TaxID=248454 RepID=A0A8S9XJ12_APOLU|nr:hypothetical protein GE061_014783 [Apolygus lucorum]
MESAGFSPTERNVSWENLEDKENRGTFGSEQDGRFPRRDDLSKENIIDWKPEVVEFESSKVGKTYLKKVRLTNQANRMAKFEIRLEKDKGLVRTYDVVFEKAMHRHFSLAPGMHMDFGVRFKCTNLDDHVTWLDIDIVDGKSFRIQVKTKRASPTLISEKFFFPSNKIISEFKKCAAITVDCGTRFLGMTTNVTAGLMNVGSEATYYITSEESWELSRIPNISDENVTHIPPFDVSPVLFRLDAGRKISLRVNYKPDCEGLHTEKLMVLCDNLALRSIDLIGEAVVFNPDHFCLNAQSKKFDVCEEEFYDAVHCVDFGNMRRNSHSTREIRFTSECPVEVEYHWELRQLPDWPEGFDIKPNQLRFSPNNGTLCSISTEEMEITCSVSDVPSGVYKSVLCFVLESIPRISLKRDDIPGQRRQTEQTVMIDLMFVELRLSVIDIYVELEPPMISFRNELNGCEHYYIHAMNTCPWEVEAEWKVPEDCIINYEICPRRTLIPPHESVAFSVMLTAMEIGEFQHVLRLECQDDNACFPLIVQGEVIVPNLPRNAFLCHDLGPQLNGSQFNFDVQLEFDESIEKYPLEYSEVEAILNLPHKRGDELIQKMWDTTNYQDPCIGITPRLQENLPYSTIFNKLDSSDLRLTSTWMTAAKHNFFVDTIALIQDADVTLEKEEITLGVDFYQRVPIKFKVSMVNKNHVCVNFKWQPPTGPDTRHAVVEYEPKSGRLCGLERISVDVTLTVDRPGSLEGLILPCILENTSKTLYFKCRGYAQDVLIRISYPSRNEMISFTWPRVPSKLLTVSEDLDMKDERCCICFISKFEDINVPRTWGDKRDIIDNLCQKIQPKAGLFLSLTNARGQLRLNESVDINVTAFSNCWGIYFDHIVIRVPELSPVIIPVLVVSEGLPVWFTMSPPIMFKYPKEDPVIYFHEMVSRSTAKQRLFVYNDSFLPVKLAWTTYVRRPLAKKQSHLCLPDELPPFSLNVEVHPQRPSSFCQLNLTDGYGDVDSTFYDVEPRIMYLEPKQTAPLTVKVNTRDVWFDLDHKMSLLRGAAHAFVYIDDNEEDDQSIDKRVDGGFSVYRPDGCSMNPLVLRMETKIEIAPLRTLNNENTVFVYKLRSYEVMKQPNKVYEEGRIYLFQNISDSIAEAVFSATGNLFIVKAVINGEECVNSCSGIKVIVRPGEIVELKTVLGISEGDMRQLVCKGGTRYADEQYPLTTILITHRDALQQMIPIYIDVQDSKIQLSVSSLDFGDVLLHDSKVLSVRVRCGEGDEKFSCNIVSGYKGVLRVSPNKGDVTERKSVNLEVIFTPKECLSYYGMLVVTPSAEAMNKLVLIFGRGSWNYKNHQRLSP